MIVWMSAGGSCLPDPSAAVKFDYDTYSLAKFIAATWNHAQSPPSSQSIDVSKSGRVVFCKEMAFCGASPVDPKSCQ